MPLFLHIFRSLGLNGISMISVQAKTPSLEVIKGQSWSTLPRLLRLLLLSTDKELCGPRFTSQGFLTRRLGLPMSSTPIKVSLSLDIWSCKLMSLLHSIGKHSVKLPASLPAGEYLLRAEIVFGLYLSGDAMLIPLSRLRYTSLLPTPEHNSTSVRSHTFCGFDDILIFYNRLRTSQDRKWRNCQSTQDCSTRCLFPD